MVPLGFQVPRNLRGIWPRRREDDPSRTFTDETLQTRQVTVFKSVHVVQGDDGWGPLWVIGAPKELFRALHRLKEGREGERGCPVEGFGTNRVCRCTQHLPGERMVLGACLSFQLRLCPLVDLRGELLLEVGAQEAVEEEPSRSIQLVRGEGVSDGGASFEDRD